VKHTRRDRCRVLPWRAIHGWGGNESCACKSGGCGGEEKKHLLAVLCSSVMHQNRRNQKTAASKPRASFISKKNTCGISLMLSPTDCNVPFPVRYVLGVLGVMMNQHLFGGKGQMRY